MCSIQLLCQLSFAIAYAAAVIFEDCGSTYELTAVQIEGCEQMKLPCFVTLGETVPVTIQFIPSSQSDRLDQDVVININFVNLRPEVTPERCDRAKCPVIPNSVSWLPSTMSVPRVMAVNQRGHLHWRLFNEREQQVLCFSVLVQTQSPLQEYLRQSSLLQILSHNTTQYLS